MVEMTDSQILHEIEKRITEEYGGGGWFEEKAGLLQVLEWIHELRHIKPKTTTIKEFDD